jgi:hypothetical protein
MYVYWYISCHGIRHSAIRNSFWSEGVVAKSWFTVDSISSEGPDAVSTALGIEPYIAKIIYNEAKKITAESSVVAP